MGRKKKYLTIDEKQLARNAQRMTYYWLNVELERQKSLKRYYDNKEKNDNLQDNKFD